MGQRGLEAVTPAGLLDDHDDNNEPGHPGLFGVDASAGDVWAVGMNASYETLIVHRC